MAWKNGQKEYMCEKCIDIVKRLRPSIGLFFEVQNTQERVITKSSNEFKLNLNAKSLGALVLILKEEKGFNIWWRP